MVRAADWRDLGLIHRVRNDGLCLDSQLAYTRGPNTLQTVILDLLTPGRSAYTLVSRASQKDTLDSHFLDLNKLSQQAMESVSWTNSGKQQANVVRIT